MSSLLLVILFLTIALLIAWSVSEFFAQCRLCLVLGTLAVLMSFGAAFVVGSLERFNSNAWFGRTTKELVDITISELEAGHQPSVLTGLKELQAAYHPTYDNCAGGDELVRAAVDQMMHSPRPNRRFTSG